MSALVKSCTACGLGFPATREFFYANKDGRLGLASRCKPCCNKATVRWQQENKQKTRDSQNRRRRAITAAKLAASPPKTGRTKKEKAAYIARWHAANQERVAGYKRRWYLKNKGRTVIDRKDFNAKRRARMAASPMQRLHSAVSRGIRKSLAGAKGGVTWQTLVGYSIGDLRLHMERQFANRMTWDNYGSYWEIDHIIPLKLFRGVAADHDILRSGWALSNLRPLRCGLNKTKSARRLLLL